jgi:hypothetical protein
LLGEFNGAKILLEFLFGTALAQPVLVGDAVTVEIFRLALCPVANR